jgi:hypothetical protein
LNKDIKLEFQRGGAFKVNLFWDKAAETCQGLWEMLPLNLEVAHAKFSGHVIYVFPGLELKMMENSRCVGVMPGEILYNPHITNCPSHPNELSMVYGPALMRDSFGYAQFNLIGRVKGDQINDFIEVGKRIDLKGREYVAILKEEEE